MSMTPHPLASEHLPKFIPGPDGSDPLFTVVVFLLVILLMAIGIIYLKLHAIPERLAHKHNNTQLQVIAVLAILALLTHNNFFWFAALLLSVIRIPDFSTPINSIADSLKRIADRENEKSTPAPDAQKSPETEA